MSLVEYEERGAIAIVSLNRPGEANAQSPALLHELDARLMEAARDETIRVIILRANGKHFSAGHDLSAACRETEPWSSMFDDTGNTGLQRMYNFEREVFFGFCRKWRDIPKATLVSVQGACIAAGLMLVWPMDIVIAADNARFSDPVVRMGISGVEYHGHTWELGARKAKEMLFTGRFIDAPEAERLGMVNRIVPLAELDTATFALAEEIARMNPYGVQMAKRVVNQTMDMQGQMNAMQAAFDVHSMCHANAWVAEPGRVTLANLDEMRAANKPRGE
jgi:enoyl-CoA hydratase